MRAQMAMAGAVVAVVAVMRGPVSGAAQAVPEAQAPQIVEASIDEIQAAYKVGTLTAHQLVQAYLDRIAKYDKQGPTINAIITLNPAVLADADRLDAQYRTSGPVGPMHGIPILVKDEIDTAGMPTTLGTLVFKDYRPTRDAFVVDRLKKAGAIVLGKATLSEFASGDTFGSMFGVTRNPYGLLRTAGGSSGGSGAGVAANFATVALGEETGASLRRPGAWNGIVALRPTPGLVSRSGMWDGYPRVVPQMGPMARSVRDLARLLDVMVGYDPEDPVTALGVGKAPESYAKFLDKNGLKGARLGVFHEVMGAATDPASDEFKNVDAVFVRNIAELQAAGAAVVDHLVIPDLKPLMATRGSDDEAADQAIKAYLARNPHSPFKTREDIAKSPDMSKSIPPTRAAQWTGPRAPTDRAQDARLLRAREQLAINVAKVIADNRLDAIVYKSVEQQPLLLEEEINPPYKNGTAYIFNLNTFLIHAAAITVPSGFTPDDLPTGLTFFGGPFTEPALIKLAYAYEQATHHRRPPKTTP
jgi:amidase